MITAELVAAASDFFKSLEFSYRQIRRSKNISITLFLKNCKPHVTFHLNSFLPHREEPVTNEKFPKRQWNRWPFVRYIYKENCSSVVVTIKAFLFRVRVHYRAVNRDSCVYTLAPLVSRAHAHFFRVIYTRTYSRGKALGVEQSNGTGISSPLSRYEGAYE